MLSGKEKNKGAWIFKLLILLHNKGLKLGVGPNLE